MNKKNKKRHDEYKKAWRKKVLELIDKKTNYKEVNREILEWSLKYWKEKEKK